MTCPVKVGMGSLSTGVAAVATFLGMDLHDRNIQRRAFLEGTTAEMVADLSWKNGRLGLHAPGKAILVCSEEGMMDGEVSLPVMERVQAACAQGARRLEAARGATPVPVGDLVLDSSGALTVRVLEGAREICSVERATGTIYPAQGDHLVEFEALAPGCLAVAQKLRASA